MIHMGGANMVFVGKCLASSSSCLASHTSGLVSPAGVKTLGCVLLGKTCCTCLNGIPQKSAPFFFQRAHLLCLFETPIKNKKYHRIPWHIGSQVLSHLIHISVTSRRLLNVLLEVLFSYSFIFSHISVSPTCGITNLSMARHPCEACDVYYRQLRLFGKISLDA